MAHMRHSLRVCLSKGRMQAWALQQWGFNMRNFISSFICDESGAAAAEYALILAIVGAGIAIAAKNLGTAISSAINTAQGNI
jgi:pilus assembly protein Flp/PilA